MHAAHEQRHTATRNALGRICSGPAQGLYSCCFGRNQRQQGFNPFEAEGRNQLCEWLAETRHCKCRGKKPGARHGETKHAAQQPFEPRPVIGILNMHAGLINKMHVIDTRGTRRHAGQARQAAVNVFDRFNCCRLILLKHVLDEVNAAARAVEFIAEQHIGRAGCRAEAAMHTRAQYLVGLGGVRVLQLFGGEIGLHVSGSYTCGRS